MSVGGDLRTGVITEGNKGDPNPTSRHSREGGNPGVRHAYEYQSSAKSSQSALVCSICLTFQARFHFFICFSRAIALGMSGKFSYQTSVVTPYRLVKPG